MHKESIDGALSRLYHAPDAPEGFETGWRAAIRREESLQMKKNFGWNRIWRTALPVFAALVLVAGSLWTDTLDMQPEAAQEQGMVMMARSSNTAAKVESAAYDMTAAADYGVSTSGMSASGGTQLTAQTERKLVRTADLTIRTQQFDAALQSAQALLEELGGYVENLYQYGDTTRRISLHMRVPSDRLDEFLGDAEGLGRVTDRSESTTDMTTQYADNQARLDTLYAKRDRLNELLVKAEDVSDLIEIESAIADTQYQIDSYETSQRSIDRQVDMSAVNLTLVEETPSETANADISLGERIRAALSASIEWLGDFLRNMLVFIVMILPVLLPVCVVALIIWLVRRCRRKAD